MADTTEKKWEYVDPYLEIQKQVLASLEDAKAKGQMQWIKDWDPAKGRPTACHNGKSGHVYSGINYFITNASAPVFETGDPRWFTFDQAKEFGGVLKGEHATRIVLMKPVTFKGKGEDGAEDKDERGFVRRAFPMFHASQIKSVPDWTATQESAPWATPEGVQKIIENSGIKVRHGGNRAYYSPDKDVIVMPTKGSFKDETGYAATLLHELGHAYGAKGRVDQEAGLKRYGAQHERAMEEAVAELTSAIVMRELGISTQSSFQNNAVYIDSWLAVFGENKAAFPQACSMASKRAEAILSLNPDYKAAQEARKEASVQREADFEARRAERAERTATPTSFDRVPPLADAYRQMEVVAGKNAKDTAVWQSSRRLLAASGYVTLRDDPDVLKGMARDERTRPIAVQAILDAREVADRILDGRWVSPPGANRQQDAKAEVLSVLAEGERQYEAAVTTAPPGPKAAAESGLDVGGALASAATAEAAARAAAQKQPDEPKESAGMHM